MDAYIIETKANIKIKTIDVLVDQSIKNGNREKNFISPGATSLSCVNKFQ